MVTQNNIQVDQTYNVSATSRFNRQFISSLSGR